MVLVELGSRLTGALTQMRSAKVVDEEVLDAMLKEIGNALVEADVSFKLAGQLRDNIKAAIKVDEVAQGLNIKRMVQKTVFDELVKLLDADRVPHTPRKGKCSVYLFVGLQGAGKTTTVSKLALYYKKRGFNPALVCADTFRAGAFDQLKQNATRIKVPFYGSYYETDPAKVAAAGVQQFREDGHDLIIVDTSGRHKQETALFQEMEAVHEAVDPDEVLFVMDSSIGQAAYDQAQAFNKAVDVGGVIMTKLDGHSRGGGALSAVAATGSPVVFYGTGEHMDALDPFDAEAFVSKLLGQGDMKGLMKTFTEVMPEGAPEALTERLTEGKFTLRDMYTQLSTITKMGPVSKVLEMMPGMGQLVQGLGGAGDEHATKRLKLMLCVLDSLTDAELDSEDKMPLKEPSRRMRAAIGAGVDPGFVDLMLEQHKMFAGMIGKMSTVSKSQGNNAHMNPQQQMQQLQQMAGAVPPGLLQSLGGMENFADILKQAEGMDLGSLFGGGGGGAGGNPFAGLMGAMGGGGGGGGGGRGGRRR